jgi:hypothetical protein
VNKRVIAPSCLILSALFMSVTLVSNSAGEEDVVPRSNGDGGAPATNGGPTTGIDSTAPTTRELSCDDNLIVLMSWETPAPVEASPQELADRFVDPAASERAVLETVGDHYAVAFLIREGGTARAELHLYRDAQGWHMGGWEACNHERVRLQP